MNNARDTKGRFVAGSHGGEAGQRDASRYPTVAHDNAHSVGSHTGTYRGLGAASASKQRSYERRAKR